MLPIFTDSYKARGAITTHPSSPRYAELIKLNVNRQIEYYQSNVRAVRNDHPLVQALKHLPSYTENPVDLFNTAYGRFPYLSKNFKFTTEYNKGSFKAHQVYSTKDSMIYSMSDYIRPYQAVSDWKSLTPLKCLWLDSSFVDMSVPNNLLNDEDKFSSVSIDLPLLSLMYKGFKESMVNSELVLGEDQFIATYVLPSILPTQVDISCVSATMAVFEGTYSTQSRVNTSIYLPSYSSEFHKIALHALNRIEGSKMQYIHMLQSIPCVYQASALDALVLPDFAPTTQVEWAMLATRLKVIDFLLEVGGKPGRDANKGFIQTLKPYCRDVRMARIPYTEMSDTMASYIDDTLTKIINLK